MPIKFFQNSNSHSHKRFSSWKNWLLSVHFNSKQQNWKNEFNGIEFSQNEAFQTQCTSIELNYISVPCQSLRNCIKVRELRIIVYKFLSSNPNWNSYV